MSKTRSAILLALAVAGLVSLTPSYAQMAAAVTSPTTQATSFDVNLSNACASGGTRTVVGKYDATSGALNTTTTLTSCTARNGDKFDGTTSTKGILVATATGFNIDITATVNTTIVRSDLSSVVRTCTSIKKGTFANATQTFDGTTSQTNCGVTGKVLEHQGVVEHILRAAQGQEDGGGLESMSRMISPQSDEDSIRTMPEMAGGGFGGVGGVGGMSPGAGMGGHR